MFIRRQVKVFIEIKHENGHSLQRDHALIVHIVDILENDVGYIR